MLTTNQLKKFNLIDYILSHRKEYLLDKLERELNTPLFGEQKMSDEKEQTGAAQEMNVSHAVSGPAEYTVLKNGVEENTRYQIRQYPGKLPKVFIFIREYRSLTDFSKPDVPRNFALANKILSKYVLELENHLASKRILDKLNQITSYPSPEKEINGLFESMPGCGTFADVEKQPIKKCPCLISHKLQRNVFYNGHMYYCINPGCDYRINLTEFIK